MGLLMIDDNKMLEWLQDEYSNSSNDELNDCCDYIYQQNTGRMLLIKDLLIEIKQGRFNGN